MCNEPQLADYFPSWPLITNFLSVNAKYVHIVASPMQIELETAFEKWNKRKIPILVCVCVCINRAFYRHNRV